MGDAEISPVHANVFINHGGATAEDFLALLVRAEQAVLERFQIDLQTEIILTGSLRRRYREALETSI